MPNLWIIFTTGLLTGGITCMAVQGGLLATTMAARKVDEDTKKSGSASAIAVFLAAKFIAHILLGLGLGWLGSVMELTPFARGVLLAVTAVYMIGVALAILDVHPFFRRFLIQTPRFLSRYIRAQSKQGEWFTPGLLGLMTVFIPCGTTQAMMALAISTGNPWYGALVMGAFVLGTSPVFFALGMAVAKLGEVMQGSFRRVAAVMILGMAVWSLSSGLSLAGVRLSVGRTVYCALTYCGDSDLADSKGAATEVTVEIKNTGYKVDNRKIKAGEQITLNLVNNGAQSCAQAFTIPSMRISRVVGVGQKDTVTFTAPAKPGVLAFSCGMGMYGGQFDVVQ